jgi:hypothetical protein
MGLNRNNDQKDAVKDFRDDRVCKFFLTGMCPHGKIFFCFFLSVISLLISNSALSALCLSLSLFHSLSPYLCPSLPFSLCCGYVCLDIFVNTKMDEGPCPKVHSEVLKQEFEKHGDKFMYDHALEKEFNHRLAEADRIIKRARMRVEDDKLDEESNPDLNPEIMRIHDEMSRIISEAEQAGANGDIDRAQDLIMIRLEDLQKDKNSIIVSILFIFFPKTGRDSSVSFSFSSISLSPSTAVCLYLFFSLFHSTESIE